MHPLLISAIYPAATGRRWLFQCASSLFFKRLVPVYAVLGRYLCGVFCIALDTGELIPAVSIRESIRDFHNENSYKPQLSGVYDPQVQSAKSGEQADILSDGFPGFFEIRLEILEFFLQWLCHHGRLDNQCRGEWRHDLCRCNGPRRLRLIEIDKHYYYRRSSDTGKTAGPPH